MDPTERESTQRLLDRFGLAGNRLHLEPGARLFAEGEPAQSVFYVESGRIRLTILSRAGREAALALLAPGDFAGMDALTGERQTRTATATALAPSTVIRISRQQLLDALRQDPGFLDIFLQRVLKRILHLQLDLADHILHPSEKRLARLLLLLAEESPNGGPSRIPRITQETLAGMTGTTRARVSFFLKHFRSLGMIAGNRSLDIDRSRLEAFLNE
ncbi:MAG: Crp/Fnr family transcriptional regulator [Terracidiphilus sp.]